MIKSAGLVLGTLCLLGYPAQIDQITTLQEASRAPRMCVCVRVRAPSVFLGSRISRFSAFVANSDLIVTFQSDLDACHHSKHEIKLILMIESRNTPAHESMRQLCACASVLVLLMCTCVLEGMCMIGGLCVIPCVYTFVYHLPVQKKYCCLTFHVTRRYSGAVACLQNACR